jgi:hypothetical protein
LLLITIETPLSEEKLLKLNQISILIKISNIHAVKKISKKMGRRRNLCALQYTPTRRREEKKNSVLLFD